MTDFDTHKWRLKKYYNESMDNILKAYLPLFDALYKCWISKKELGKKE